MSFSSQQDFERFYQKQATRVRGLLFRLVGDGALNDIAQEAFMKAWENRDRFRGESEASTWLFRIAYNCAIDHLRKNKPREFEAELEEPPPSLETAVGQRQLADQALKSLDVEHRAVAVLFYLEDFSVREVAEALNIPEGTVKSRLNHARQKMTGYLSRKGVQI